MDYLQTVLHVIWVLKPDIFRNKILADESTLTFWIRGRCFTFIFLQQSTHLTKADPICTWNWRPTSWKPQTGPSPLWPLFPPAQLAPRGREKEMMLTESRFYFCAGQRPQLVRGVERNQYWFVLWLFSWLAIATCWRLLICAQAPVGHWDLFFCPLCKTPLTWKSTRSNLGDL